MYDCVGATVCAMPSPLPSWLHMWRDVDATVARHDTLQIDQAHRRRWRRFRRRKRLLRKKREIEEEEASMNYYARVRKRYRRAKKAELAARLAEEALDEALAEKGAAGGGWPAHIGEGFRGNPPHRPAHPLRQRTGDNRKLKRAKRLSQIRREFFDAMATDAVAIAYNHGVVGLR